MYYLYKIIQLLNCKIINCCGESCAKSPNDEEKPTKVDKFKLPEIYNLPAVAPQEIVAEDPTNHQDVIDIATAIKKSITKSPIVKKKKLASPTPKLLTTENNAVQSIKTHREITDGYFDTQLVDTTVTVKCRSCSFWITHHSKELRSAYMNRVDRCFQIIEDCRQPNGTIILNSSFVDEDLRPVRYVDPKTKNGHWECKYCLLYIYHLKCYEASSSATATNSGIGFEQGYSCSNFWCTQCGISFAIGKNYTNEGCNFV